MDNELIQLLTHPFTAHSQEKKREEEEREALLHMETAAMILTGRKDTESHAIFRQPIETVLRPHKELLDKLMNRIFYADHPPELKGVVEKRGEILKSLLEELSRNYRVYVETASADSLEREAQRLERRYFQETGRFNQLRFIKLKRFYEKVKTFNELARKNWREISKEVDTFSLTTELSGLVQNYAEKEIQNITRLIRKTENFLESLRNYMQVEEDSYDSLTHSFKIVLTYAPSHRYTLPGFFGDPEEEEEVEEVEQEDLSVLKTAEEEEEEEEGDYGGSIARNIVIETQEHRLNKNSIFSVPILGSRDWNRTPHYQLEVPLIKYRECLARFRESHLVVIDPRSLQTHMTSAAAQLRKGNGAKNLAPYLKMLREEMDRNSEEVVLTDFPGLEKPSVFLYHCGPRTIYNILIATFQQNHIGEIFYLDENQSILREFPMEVIQKELVDWWTDKFSLIGGEEVDSYITYSRALDMVKKDYRILYDEGVQLRKREHPGASYAGLDEWLRKNRNRIFGLRKVEIFKRFINDNVFE